MHLKTCCCMSDIFQCKLKKLCCPEVWLCMRAEGAAHAAIAVAAAAVVASERSPKGSPRSCLACSDGIPGSVPSDCRLAPLPPSLTHTHKPAASIVAPPPTSSSLLQCGAVWHLHIHSSPCTHWLSFLSISTQILFTIFTPAFIRLSLVSPQSECHFFLFLLPSFVSRVSVWF